MGFLDRYKPAPETLSERCADCGWRSEAVYRPGSAPAHLLQEALQHSLAAHRADVHPPPDPGLLTEQEHEALQLTARLAGLFSLIVADGPAADADLAELHLHLHAIQRAIGANAAARAYPGKFRLLGDRLR